LIEIKNLDKVYKTPNGDTVALKDINLTINDGEIFGIIGLSGAGKSTLIRCINMLEKPSNGSILIDGTDVTKLKERELRSVRKKIGMIFQGFNLLEQRTVLRNVMFPLEISGVKKEEAKMRALELLELVGLKEKINSYPSMLSGGEKQRVAIARALTTNPNVLLSDEATSALDPNTTQTILELLKEINQKLGVTIIIITHEMKVIDQICNRVAIIDKSHINEIGDVSEVFAAPKTKLAQQLIKSSSTVDRITSGTKVRLIFDNANTYEPVVSNMILECQVPVNILNADVNDYNGSIVGQMLLLIPGDERQQAKVFAYLKAHNIRFEEVLDNGLC
jgi:D-methionine transport system ATP-binding protein